MHGEQYRISLDLPPMAALFFKIKNKRTPPSQLEKLTEETAEKAPEKQTEDTKKPDAVTKGATGKQKSAPAKNHAKTAADGDDHMKITAQKVGTGGNI